MTLLRFTKPSDFEWAPPDVFPDLSNAEEIAIDLETRDPDMEKSGPGWPTLNGEIVGFALAVDGWKCYLPIAHEGGGNLDRKRVMDYIQEVLSLPADKIMFNAAYDMGWLIASGFHVEGKVYDAMIAAALVDENRYSYSLNMVGRDYVGELKSEEKLKKAAAEFGFNPKKDLWRLPALYVGEYAEQDAALTLKLWQVLKKELVVEEVRGIFDLETELFPILLNMTRCGIRFDTSRAHEALAAMQKRQAEIQEELVRISGAQIDIWAAASIAAAFNRLQLPFGRTAKGSPSFTKGFLNSHPHPMAKLIVEARELNKATGTFIEKLMGFSGATGRIHPHINQIRSDDGGTVTGRFSMNNPNLQQIPARNADIGPLIRSMFLPEEGEQWASLDFSQQEPRILVHYGVRQQYKTAHAAADLYRENPDNDFHQMVADMAGIDRKQAKTIGLGLMYGMGKAKMAAELDLPEAEASVLISTFHEKVPFLRSLSQTVMQRAQERGSIYTLMGRRCRFPLFEPAMWTKDGVYSPLPEEEARNKWGKMDLRRAYTYKALNRLIQGSAADQTKVAIVECYKRLGKIPMLQVHDELCFSVKTREEAEELKEIMETCVTLEVPSKVDLEMGPSWGEAV
jgi:DNA polymerase I-like protein with 3'-5' exonuclease and polymerase domains